MTEGQSMNEHEFVPESAQTRREFIRKAARTSVYAVPLVITFSKASLAQAHLPSGGRKYHRSYHHSG